MPAACCCAKDKARRCGSAGCGRGPLCKPRDPFHRSCCAFTYFCPPPPTLAFSRAIPAACFTKDTLRLLRRQVVLAHSGLLHSRRAKPGGGRYQRYFVDVSYCQPPGPDGRKWPAYGSGGNAGRCVSFR